MRAEAAATAGADAATGGGGVGSIVRTSASETSALMTTAAPGLAARSAAGEGVGVPERSRSRLLERLRVSWIRKPAPALWLSWPRIGSSTPEKEVAEASYGQSRARPERKAKPSRSRVGGCRETRSGWAPPQPASSPGFPMPASSWFRMPASAGAASPRRGGVGCPHRRAWKQGLPASKGKPGPPGRARAPDELPRPPLDDPPPLPLEQLPAWQVWLRDAQSWHAMLPVPQTLSLVPGWHTPWSSQQPVAHDWGPHGPPPPAPLLPPPLLAPCP